MPTPSDTLREQLAEFIAIPSVSADAAHAADIVAAAEWIAEKIRSAGGSAELVPWGARPLVVGEVAASERPESAPTVLCYAHFDVQPEDPLDLWESPPFELTHRDGRLYARGIADDKGNMFLLVEAVRQLAAAGELPVNVRFAFDGEEEIGGNSIVEWVDADQGDADAALILDGAMIRRGQPAFMVGVRGMVYAAPACPDGRDRHAFGNVRRGGAQCDARAHDRAERCSSAAPTAASRTSCARGNDSPTAEELEAWAQLPSGAEQLAQQGASPIAPGAAEDFYVRTFADTSLDVNGIARGSPDLVKTVLPVEARANVSMRLAPGQDPVDDPDDVRAARPRSASRRG